MKKKSILTPVLFVLGFGVLWQIIYLLNVFPKILFPSVVDILEALLYGFQKESLAQSTFYSLSLIFKGLLIGIVLALIFSTLSVFNSVFRNIYGVVISFCDPLPGIALLPIALLWFGIGEATIVFIIVHSVIWPFSRSIIDGFGAVPQTYIEVGKNIGLSGYKIIWGVYVLSAFPYILSGLKTGWARAWRALISAEMIFGATGAVGGLGWYIFTRRYRMDTPGVYATLLIIIVIGLVVEYVLFEKLEKNTVRKWGVVR